MKRDKRYRLEQVSIERAWNSSTYIKLKFEVIEGRDDRKFLARPRTFATTDSAPVSCARRLPESPRLFGYHKSEMQQYYISLLNITYPLPPFQPQLARFCIETVFLAFIHTRRCHRRAAMSRPMLPAIFNPAVLEICMLAMAVRPPKYVR